VRRNSQKRRSENVPPTWSEMVGKGRAKGCWSKILLERAVKKSLTKENTVEKIDILLAGGK